MDNSDASLLSPLQTLRNLERSVRGIEISVPKSSKYSFGAASQQKIKPIPSASCTLEQRVKSLEDDRILLPEDDLCLGSENGYFPTNELIEAGAVCQVSHGAAATPRGSKRTLSSFGNPRRRGSCAPVVRGLQEQRRLSIIDYMEIWRFSTGAWGQKCGCHIHQHSTAAK